MDEIVNGYFYNSSNPNDFTNYTFHHDQVNSVTALTGHNGTTEDTTTYDPFGAPTLMIPGSGNELLFTGREYDQSTGFYYYRARYYDTDVDRFISEDPLGFEAGINFYAYVNNNPVNYNDPTGNCPNCVAGAGGAIIGGIAGGVTAFIKSGGDFDATVRGAATGAVFGGLAGFTFGASTTATTTALTVRGAATGFASGAGGNAAGQFFGNEGVINISESLVHGAFSTVPGAAQNALRAQALTAGLSGSTANTLGVLGLSGQLKVGAASMSVGVSPLVPEFEVNLSDTFSVVDSFLQDPVTNFDSLFQGGSAGGGFVLYPNKPNTNMINQVYSK